VTLTTYSSLKDMSALAFQVRCQSLYQWMYTYVSQ
jgi:hypothetical protein